MSALPSKIPPNKAGKSHEPGALGAYGLIVGTLAGIGIGLFLSHWLFLGVVGACVGWVAGLLIERSRR